jgi:prevent-host-death family protein
MRWPVKWSVAEAKQRLSELLRDAAREPQTIFSRSRPVGVVVDPESFEGFKAWQAARARTLAEAFDELRSLASTTGYVLPVPKRRNRKSAFGGATR